MDSDREDEDEAGFGPEGSVCDQRDLGNARVLVRCGVVGWVGEPTPRML